MTPNCPHCGEQPRWLEVIDTKPYVICLTRGCKMGEWHTLAEWLEKVRKHAAV